MNQVRIKGEIKELSQRMKALTRKANALALRGIEGGTFWREAKEMNEEIERMVDRMAALKSLEFSLGVLIRDSKRMCFKVIGGRANRTGSVSGKKRTKILSSAQRSFLKDGEFGYEFDNMVALAKALKIGLPKGVDMQNWRIV